MAYVLPDQPNEPIRVTYGFYTDLIRAESGAEDRISPSTGNPRLTISYQYEFDDDELRTQRLRLLTQLHDEIIVPAFYEQHKADTSNLAVGDISTISSDVSSLNVVVDTNDQIFIGENLVTITNITDTELSFTPSIEFRGERYLNIWPAIGVVRNRNNNSINNRQYNGGAINLSAIASENPPIKHNGQMAFLNNLPVIEENPLTEGRNWNEEYNQHAQILDSESRSTYKTITTADKANMIRAASFHIETLEQLEFWKRFISYTQGRLNPFFQTTYKQDLKFVQFGQGGERNIVAIENADNIQTAVTPNQLLRVVMPSGNAYYATVRSIYTLPSSATAVVTLDKPIIGNEEPEQIEFVHKCRLASDNITVTHYAQYSEISFRIETLLDNDLEEGIYYTDPIQTEEPNFEHTDEHTKEHT